MSNSDLPYSAEAESVVLTSCLFANEYENGEKELHAALEELTAEDFHHEKNRILFWGICELVKARQTVDELLLAEALRNWKWTDFEPDKRKKAVGKPLFEIVGGMVALTKLSDFLPQIPHVAHFRAIVRDKSRQRTALLAARELVRLANEPAQNFEDVQTRLGPVLTQLAGLATQEHAVSLPEVVERLIEDEEAKGDGRAPEIDQSRMITAGLNVVDERLSSWNPIEQDLLCVIAGISSHGKSSLVRQLMWNALVRGQRVVAVLTETTRRKNAAQMASSMSLWNLKQDYELQRQEEAVTGHDKHPSDWLKSGEERYQTYLETLRWIKSLSNNQLFLFEQIFDIDRIVTQVEMIARQTGRVDLVVVDYLQELSHDGHHNLRSDEIIGGHCRKLKQLSKRIQAPTALISSLTKEGIDPQTGPTPNCLRGSGDIWYAADRLWFVHRPQKDLNGTEQGPDRKSFYTLLNQAKGRDLWCGAVGLNFIPRFTRFRDFHKIPDDKRGRPRKDAQ